MITQDTASRIASPFSRECSTLLLLRRLTFTVDRPLPPPDGYASWLGQHSFAPIPEPLGIAAAQELFEAMQMWLDGNTDAMATVLKI